MNNDCSGDYFVIEHRTYYRCFYDGTVILVPFQYIQQNATCSNCKRPIDASEVKHVSRRLVEQIQLEQNGAWLDLPKP